VFEVLTQELIWFPTKAGWGGASSKRDLGGGAGSEGLRRRSETMGTG